MVESGASEIIKKGVEYILVTPQAIVFFFFSWISGHLWAYVVFTYCQKKENAKGFFDGNIGKMTLGVIWFTIIGLPFYYFVNKKFTIDHLALLDLSYSIVMTSLFIQGLIFIFTTLFKRAP
ncbi:hypothetical protein D0U00_15215 [Leclercia adecarboxylata]|uniref:hypothetical protein n=1 Tax=Leclercia adecarboxylata TaxID=83655 RepID=UPI000E3BAE47|nr:hypothetical protein [Leclercia adecarboxylata]RFS78124.1 hypothetical protein D0U00_15215 [Leclercia adecarboxylata]